MKKLLIILATITYGTCAYASCDKTQQINALALNMYHEARGEGHDGMLAVGEVTLNRVKNKRFPDTICGVVYQGYRNTAGSMVRFKCQFSWYCDGKSDIARDTKLWKESKRIATGLVNGSYETLGLTATHYHATHVKPYWSREYDLVGRFGKHIFYDMGDKS